jgi:hypothetical protein
VAKALDENGFDGEERKLGEQTGLDIETSVSRISLIFCLFTNTTEK